MRTLAVIATATAAVAIGVSPAVAGEEKDEAIVKRGLIRAGDVPDGWESEPPEENEPTGLRECRALDRAVRASKKVPYAESRTFSDPDDPSGVRSVENGAYVFPNVKAAKGYIAVFQADDATDCLIALGETGFPDGEVTTEALDVEDFGDDSVGFSLLVTDVSETGEPFTVSTDLVVVRVGRGILGFGAQNPDAPLPQGPEILDSVVGRFEDALSSS